MAVLRLWRKIDIPHHDFVSFHRYPLPIRATMRASDPRFANLDIEFSSESKLENQ